MVSSSSFDPDIGISGVDKPNEIDEIHVPSFAMESFIEAIFDDSSQYYDIAHFVNNRSNFFDRYNFIVMELFALYMPPSDESGVYVREAYVLEKLFDQDNYVLIPPTPFH
jgi:hypothetical protein